MTYANWLEEFLPAPLMSASKPQVCKFTRFERSAHAHALAGSMFSLLDWWIDKGMKSDPQEMDDLFHRMAWKGLETP